MTLRTLADTNLCDHSCDVAGVGGQKDGVGLFGQVGEGGDVLFSHTQGSSCVSILKKYQIFRDAPIPFNE